MCGIQVYCDCFEKSLWRCEKMMRKFEFFCNGMFWLGIDYYEIFGLFWDQTKFRFNLKMYCIKIENLKFHIRKFQKIKFELEFKKFENWKISNIKNLNLRYLNKSLKKFKKWLKIKKTIKIV